VKTRHDLGLGMIWDSACPLSCGARHEGGWAKNPRTPEASARLSARELAIVLWNGNPQQAGMADDWR
jgi:hypothetical protein